MLEKLACKRGRNDEVPNIDLAIELCKNEDRAGIKEIADGLKGADKSVANDCIKVLYEIGARNPSLIAGYANDFLSCLRSRNNRLVWGGMTALAAIVEYCPQIIFENIAAVIYAYENGSVITADNSISVFAGLCATGEDYAKEVLPIILKHLQKCRPKEVAQHAERASVCFNSGNADDFIKVLEKRKPDLTPPQQTRIKKVLKTLYGLRKPIRHLEEKDIENCLALMELVKDDFAGYKKDEFIKAMREAVAEKEAFVVYMENEIAGLIAFSYKNREITFLAVSPGFRKKGIAKNLIGEVAKCFRPGDMLHVVTFRDGDPKGGAAIACYRACGFTTGELVEVYGYPCQKMVRWV